jgi:chemotaxis protein MotB
VNLRSITIIAACVSLPAIGCVTQGRYDDALRDANTARAELAKERVRRLEQEQGRAEMQASLQQQLDDAASHDEELQAELRKLGENSQQRLEELRRAHAAAEARAALYADLARKLKSMIDAGDLSITLRDGRMVLRLPNDILFDSGRAELKPNGKRALTEIATALRTIPGRHFQVAGHTDSEPIRVSPFRSNWDLSTARALEVSGFLIRQGVDPHALSVAGYGEFDPVDTNDSAPAKAHNRRTEITLQPNIDEFVAVPEP